MLSNYNLIVFAHKSNYLLLKNKYFFKKISYFFTNKTKVFHSLFRNACIYYKTQQSIQIQFIIRKVTFFFNLLKKNTFFLLHFIQFHIHFFNFQIKKSHFVQKKNLTLHFIRLDSIIFIKKNRHFTIQSPSRRVPLKKSAIGMAFFPAC